MLTKRAPSLSAAVFTMTSKIWKCRHTRGGLGLSPQLCCSVSRWLVTASLSNSSLGGACACGAAGYFHAFPSSTKIRSSGELLSAVGLTMPGCGAYMLPRSSRCQAINRSFYVCIKSCLKQLLPSFGSQSWTPAARHPAQTVVWHLPHCDSVPLVLFIGQTTIAEHHLSDEEFNRLINVDVIL